MANTSTLLCRLPSKVGGRGPIFCIRTLIDTAGDHTVLTPDATVLNTAGVAVKLPAGRWWIVGCDFVDAVSKDITIKSGATTLQKSSIAAGGGIGKEVNSGSFWLAGLDDLQPLIVNLSANASPTSIVWHVIVSPNFGV